MVFIACAFCIGIVAGLRALTAPTLISWAASAGWLSLSGTWLEFLGYRWTPWIFSFLAVGELINDKLPQTPSRKVPAQFGARVITGALSGAAITVAHGSTLTGLLAGALGAVAGTLCGADARTRLVRAIGGKDLPVALLEDTIAILSALFIVRQLS